MRIVCVTNWIFNICIINVIRDGNIDNRIIDTAVGHDARLGLRVFHEERHVAEAAEVAAWLCVWRDGGGIGMVAADSVDGNGGRQRTVVCFARCRRIPVGYGVPADD